DRRQRRERHRETDIAAALARGLPRRKPPLAKANDVLDDDDRAVDEHADTQRAPHERQEGERAPGDVHPHDREEKRERARERGEDGEGDAPEEGEKNDDRARGSDGRAVAERAARRPDEAPRVEARVDVDRLDLSDRLPQPLANGLELALDPLADL